MKLLYMDTDSLIYSLKCDDFYEIMKRDIHRYDTSVYPNDNIYNMPQKNKKVVGLMKDECNGRICRVFVALRSKIYSLKMENEDLVKKVKGVKSNVVQNKMTFEDFKNSLFNHSLEYRKQYTICSKNHKVITKEQSKLVLSPHDDKRYLIKNDTHTTLPWGHKEIV